MASSTPNRSLLPDEEIVRHFQETQDPVWFDELFARYQRKVYFACRAFHWDGTAAEDATQETFLRAYEKIHQFGGGDFAGWLMRIAKNICIDRWRRRRAGTEVAETELGERGIEGVAAAPDLDLQLSAQQVWHEIKSLPVQQRQCLEMKIEGYSYEEIAARTRMTVEAVKSHLQNGRRMLWLKMEGTMVRAK
jgi:RNA polymerase sigma-70 factor, ECF subfamily